MARLSVPSPAASVREAAVCPVDMEKTGGEEEWGKSLGELRESRLRGETGHARPAASSLSLPHTRLFFPLSLFLESR